MFKDLRTKQGQNELAESIAQSFTMKEVPLIVANASDQQAFVPWMADLVRGRIISSREHFPMSRFIESLDHLDYVFLQFENGVPDELYLIARDYALHRDVPLTTTLGSHAIHPDHRLAIFIDSGTLSGLAEDLRRVLCTATMQKYVSGNEEDTASNRESSPRVFNNIEAAIAWCDRYYSNGQFLFRGQTQDWPLLAPIHRVTDKADHDREAKRTLSFMEWVTSGNALIKDTKLSEDQALAVAQHHGLKTPLLDVSRNVRVAAFFATHAADLDVDKNGVIHVFHDGDLRRYMNLDGDLGEKLGRGLFEPKIEPLRRIRHQQGLFFESRPWLIQDMILATLSFRQNPRGVGIKEGFAPPREFIYPPPSAFEKIVETYLLIENAIGARERHFAEIYPVPTPSFDSAGFTARAFLDELDPKPIPPFVHLHQTLDGNAALLALNCSHLLAHQSHYLNCFLEAGQFLRKGSLTAEMFLEFKKHIRGAQNHMNRPWPTKIEKVPDLSIRDIVDGLAIYHDIRFGNPDVTSAHFDHRLSTDYKRLRNAYACADHWLGDLAWDMFPVAAAFALNCQDPVAAFLGAVVEMGKHEVAFLTRYSAQDGERILAQWTGYEPIKLDEVTTQLALPVFQQRSVDRFHVSLREHPEHTANLGPFLYRQRDVETIRQLMPQFILHKDFELRALPHGTDLAEAVYPLSAEISVLEGLAGLETTMHCQLAECPFFRFRICGRVPAI